MAKLTKKQLSHNGTTIMSMAAKIRKAKPKKMWKECVAEAGKLFGGKGKKSVKVKKAAPKRKVTKVKKVKKTTKRK